MTTIAQLGVVVTRSGIAEADRELGKLASTGAKVEQQSAKTAAGMQKTALSAKQLRAATQGLPAQFTDIATALGSGQRPLQVLLQQGGQLKDMFGGIGPAVRATGSHVAGLINPFTVAAAVIAGLGVAAFKAGEQTEQLNRALILSGNYAGLTVEKLRDMSRELDASTGASAGKAVEALAQVTASGRFTAEQIEMVSRAAINMQQSTGQSIEDTVKQFERLAKDPVTAILDLNEAQHFLTRETLDQIEALKEQGKTAQAAEVAFRAYADSINGNADEINKNLSSTSAIWRDIKSAVSEAGDEVVQFFADADTAVKGFLSENKKAAATIADLLNQSRIPSLQQFGFVLGSATANAARPKTGAGPVVATVNSGAERARLEAQKDFDRLALSNLSKREALEREIADIRKTGVAAGKTELEIEKQVTAARARFAESQPKGRKGRTDSESAIQNARDRFADMTARFQAELEGPLQRAEGEHIRRMREIEQAARKGKVSHEDLAEALDLEGQAYARAREEIQHRFDAEVAALTGPVAAARDQHEAALRRIEELQKQAGLTGEQYNAMLGEEAKRYREAALEAERAADPIRALLDDMQFEIDTIGRSNAQRAVMNELRRQGIDIMSEEAQAALATADAFEAEARAKDRSIELMDEFRRGASDALTDFVTGAKSAKEAAKDFLDDLGKRLTQLIADQLIEKAFGAMGTNGAGTSGGGWLAAAASALFGGGRAMGGPVSGGRIYEVAENGPEMFTSNGRSYLIPRTQGHVTPMRQGASSGAPVTQIFQTTIQGRMDKSTEEQFHRRQGREAARGMSRTGR